MNANQSGDGTRLTETRLQHKWVGRDSNPEPTPKVSELAALCDASVHIAKHRPYIARGTRVSPLNLVRL